MYCIVYIPLQSSAICGFSTIFQRAVTAIFVAVKFFLEFAETISHIERGCGYSAG